MIHKFWTVSTGKKIAPLPLLHDLRAKASGCFLRHRAGLTYLVEDGREDEPAILLVHGATVPHWEFDRLVPHLRLAGYRTVRFDCLGHGLSDRPDVAYDFALFVEQALEVLDGIRSTQPLTLLGHSFGAAIASAITRARPDKVDRLVLVAPLLDFMAGAVLPTIFGLPGIGRPLMRHVGLPALNRRRQRRYAAIQADDLTPRFIAEASTPGYAEALASMFACRTLGDQRAQYRSLQGGRHEIIVIAGSADRVVPMRDVNRVRSLLPDHRYLEIQGAEHNLLLTHPDVVSTAIARPTVVGRHALSHGQLIHS
jgi:pimeloyl-ACP methyl ester carboxylesterase